MSILDRFLGGIGTQRPSDRQALTDEQAIARYRYLLRTAPPEAIEQAHAEAFAQLTPDQRRRVLQDLSAELPPGERNAALSAGDSPESLARVATRAELRQPGTMERAFGGLGGVGLGGLMAGSLLSSMAGTVLGTMIAQHFFNSHPEASHLLGGDTHTADAATATDASTTDLSADPWERLGDAGDSSRDLPDVDSGFDSWDV